MDEREGPILFGARATCIGCKWLNRRLVKTGRNPEHWNACRHPSVDVTAVVVDGLDGRYIGTSDSTPGWCPVQAMN